ncbi:hypothetical protein TIFTF001_016166 [Ficus carica]|uniref:Uncharacterized protein n=1 Tax=Ficus carica TaxID=3494 RepID=A0AA88AJ07_FICCA|nr:hypothetical protein TIFTF001_016166 [Ficus carica]
MHQMACAYHRQTGRISDKSASGPLTAFPVLVLARLVVPSYTQVSAQPISDTRPSGLQHFPTLR